MSKETSRIRGMFRLQIQEDDGRIVGDSGWKENLITNAGFLNVVNQMGTSLTGSKISHAGLGTGGAPSASDTTLSGEVLGTGGVVIRAALTAATSSTSKTLRNTATFSSAASFITASANISNVGLFQSSSSGTLLQGNTFSSSALATNQNVNITYDLILA